MCLGLVVQALRGTITARKVILASNAYITTLVPEYQNKINPVQGTCCRIVVPESSTAPRLTNTYNLYLTVGRLGL